MDGSIANQYVQTDLRDFLAAVEEGGELKHVAGAHWDKEIGAVTSGESIPVVTHATVQGFWGNYIDQRFGAPAPGKLAGEHA